MAERNELKLRTCKKCNQPIVATAQGIKDHAQDCKFGGDNAA